MEKQELFCHACERYVRFDVPDTDGRLIVECPNCGHEHYRIVKNGVITEERWGSANRNMSTVYATGTSTSTGSFVAYYTASSTTAGTGSTSFIAQSWLNTGTS